MQHVPHRICAALTWLDMRSPWTMPRPPTMPKNGNFHVWCLGRSVEEGHLAAMRWLIEFVGVTFDPKSGTPIPPRPHSNGKSVSVQEVGGSMFPLSNLSDALFLAKVWQACSQASLHPTTDTNHIEISHYEIARALQLVIDHLQIALYGPKGRYLHQIVHDQERLAIERGRSSNRGKGARANVVVRLLA